MFAYHLTATDTVELTLLRQNDFQLFITLCIVEMSQGTYDNAETKI